MSLADSYLPVVIFALVGILFPPATWALTRLFRPRKPTLIKDTTYECGEIPIGEAQIQFSFQYYIFALIFVVFDCITVFLALWALSFAEWDEPLMTASAFLVSGFLAMLLVATYYALKKEARIWI